MKKYYIFADNLFAHEILHLLSGVLMFFLLSNLFGRAMYGIIGFLVSLFIDADHYLEGLVYNKFRIGWMFKTYPNEFWKKSGIVTLLFHSWEFLLVIFLAGKITNNLSLAYSIIYPAILHYLIDNLIYSGLRGMSIFQYFLIYRAVNKFSYNKLCHAKS